MILIYFVEKIKEKFVKNDIKSVHKILERQSKEHKSSFTCYKRKKNFIIKIKSKFEEKVRKIQTSQPSKILRGYWPIKCKASD